MISRTSDESNPSHAENLPAGTIRCTSCGTVGYQNDKYCPCCGTQLLRSCKECGSMIVHPIAYYCTACGAVLDAAARPPAADDIGN